MTFPHAIQLTLPSDSAHLGGTVRVPGDKSISHRALMLAALAVGESRIAGLLQGEDVLATAGAMRALGADLSPGEGGVWHVHGAGVGSLLQPLEALDLGNSGTSARLLMGLLATHPLSATLVGDASLSRRPMERVMRPLARMGAEFIASPGGRLPLTMRGLAPAIPIRWRLEVPSAQVKSAILLAGLNADGETTVEEPVATRDHSERMLKAAGADLSVETVDGLRIISVRGPATLRPTTMEVPGDPSSAAFLAVAATIIPGSEILIEGVGLNPTRDGLFRVLGEMGADIAYKNPREVGGEPVADLLVRAAPLTGIEVPPEIAPAMIDEYPALFVAAALASGETAMRGLGELRVKESDRISAMARALSAAGVDVEELSDGLVVLGTGGSPVPGGSLAETRLDHRVAMSMCVLSLAARAPITVDDARPIATSFPGFADLMARLGAVVQPAETQG
ncbi:MAG: 3-phosphoshikimate 1-carboxyvinyltransferase [Thermaurantiacus sp.]